MGVNNYKTSQAGVDLIKEFEGFEARAYPDPGTGDEPWTIGYGHTGDVRPGMVITPAQGETLLKRDLAKFEGVVNEAVTTPIDQHQFDALVSFAFNCGPANLRSSTLLKMVNARNFVGAKAQFGRWNRAAGRVMTGLTRRRKAEAALFGA